MNTASTRPMAISPWLAASWAHALVPLKLVEKLVVISLLIDLAAAIPR